MKGKGRSRLIEWGKTLLIILLAISALYLLGETQFSEDALGGVKDFFAGAALDKEDDDVEQAGPAVVHPMHLAMNLEGGQRYGVQYNMDETDSVFSSISTLLSEALSSIGTPRKVSERVWRDSLSGVGIYLDLYYPIPLNVLSGQLGVERSGVVSDNAVRRLCLAAGQDNSVALLYINEMDGGFYSCSTTLSQDIHLAPVLENQSANGAMFAFEVSGMQNIAPYMLMTATPQPLKYSSENPLVSDSGRISQLLDSLSFQSGGSELDPLTGGILVEGNDSLRLFESGVLTFHAMGNADFRFLLSENTLQSALERTQGLANATVGAWCGDAGVCLAGVQESEEGLEILYQYCLNGIPVELPAGNTAARFVINNGAIADFALYFRRYTATEETTLILPELQAAAVFGASTERGKELTLLYQDAGGETICAGWVAN